MDKSKIITYAVIAIVLAAGGWYVYKTYYNTSAKDSTDDGSNAQTYADKVAYNAAQRDAGSTSYQATTDRKKAARFFSW